MEPLDDRELKQALETWKAPPAPGRLRDALFPRSRDPWWSRFWRARIAVPVPLAVSLIALLLAFAVLRPPVRTTRTEPVATVTFRELQPVKELKPRIIRRHYE